MKKQTCIGFAFLGLILLAAAVFIIPTVWGKPWVVEHFYARVLLKYTLQHPLLLSHLGLLEPYGLDFYNDDIDDYSVDATERECQFWRDNLKTLRSYDRDRLDDRLSYDTMEWYIADKVAGATFAFHDYPVNQWVFGNQSKLPDDMVQSHRIEDIDDTRDYLSRVSQFGRAMQQLIQSVEYRRELGVTPPRFVFQKSIEQMRAFISVPAKTHLLYTNFAEKTAQLTDLDPEDRQELLDRLELLIKETVYPGYQALIETCARLEPQLSTDDGVWKHPNGAAYYAHLLRSFTTTDMSAEEIHQYGLAEVTRIQEEMCRILVDQSRFERDLQTSMQALNKDPVFLYPDTPEGRQLVLSDYQKIVDEIDAGLDQWFSMLPKQKVVVKRIPEFKEEDSALAYYSPPSLDGVTQGVLFVNLRSMPEINKFSMRSLAYHEIVPGHHYQWDVHTQMTDLPMVRRLLPFTAYIEGWALYAEQLAAEVGYQDDPFDRLGYLRDELLRACRMVVDTGIHRERWTRQQAIEYLLRNSGLHSNDITAEVDRFIVYPGHACAYGIGLQKIRQLRQRAKNCLGQDFDLREFHDVILKTGALPLELLEQVIDEWLAEKCY